MEKLAPVVLAGGKSIRMGQDKAGLKLACLPQEFLNGHDYPAFSGKNPLVFRELDFLWQSLWTFSKLIRKYSFFEKKIYISCREEQKELFLSRCRSYPDIAETDFIFDGGDGVCGALISCLDFLRKPLFCLPCDAPFVSEDNILALVKLWLENKDPNICQYTYVDPANGRKETLISLYTPQAEEAFRLSMEKKIRVQNSIADDRCVLVPFSGNLRHELKNFNFPHDFLK